MKKSPVNIHKKRQVVITVLFDHSNRVFLTKKHQPDSTFLHGKWQLPGLGMERGERYEQTLRRIENEFGVAFKPQTNEPIESLSYRNKTGYTLLHIFPCTIDNQSVPAQNAIWLSIEEITPENCIPLTLEIIKSVQYE